MEDPDGTKVIPSSIVFWPFRVNTRNSSGDEIAKRNFSVYLFILQLYINKFNNNNNNNNNS